MDTLKIIPSPWLFLSTECKIFQNLGRNLGRKIFQKKKLFFLAMFKNEITLLKKFFFENFQFFSEKYFQKNGHNFFFESVFDMNFFFQPCSFF